MTGAVILVTDFVFGTWVATASVALIALAFSLTWFLLPKIQRS